MTTCPDCQHEHDPTQCPDAGSCDCCMSMYVKERRETHVHAMHEAVVTALTWLTADEIREWVERFIATDDNEEEEGDDTQDAGHSGGSAGEA
jgi:hypothetical protein